MEVSRWAGMGHAHFRSKFLIENHKGIYDFEKRFNLFPALVPAMKGKRDDRLAPPTDLRLDSGLISWQGDAPYYNIYVSDHWPVDTDNPANLLLAPLRPQADSHRFGCRASSVGGPSLPSRPWTATATRASRCSISRPSRRPTSRSCPRTSTLPTTDSSWTSRRPSARCSRWTSTAMPSPPSRASSCAATSVRCQPRDRSSALTSAALADGVYWVYAHNKRTKKMVRVGSFEIDRQQVGFVR